LRVFIAPSFLVRLAGFNLRGAGWRHNHQVAASQTPDSRST